MKFCLLNYVFYVYRIFSISDARVYRCGDSDQIYNETNQGCCGGVVYNSTTVGGEDVKCCEDRKETYKVRTQICCGKELKNKSDNDLCCENNLRSKENGICCDDIWYDDIYECCGKKGLESNRQLKCCNGVIHEGGKGTKCCGSKSYNSTTHYCKRKNEPLPFGHDKCNEEIYKTDDNICCNKRLLRKDNDKVKCCGDGTYMEEKNDCSYDHVVPKGHSWCHKKNKPYNPNKDICAEINDGDYCAGRKYDKHNNKCCGGEVVDSSKKCCGGKVLNTKDYVCCKTKGKIIKKKSDSDDACCSSQPDLIPYDEDSQICTTEGIVDIKKDDRNESATGSCKEMCINWKTKKGLLARGFKSFLLRNKTGGLIFRKTKHSKNRRRNRKTKSNDESLKSTGEENKQQKGNRRNNETPMPSKCLCIMGRKVVILSRSEPSWNGLAGNFYIKMRNQKLGKKNKSPPRSNL